MMPSHSVFGTMLICVGVLVAASGAIAMARHRARTAYALRIARLPPTQISDAREDQRVRIDGMAVARDEGGLLVAPCSGLPAVWFRVRVHRIVGTRRPRCWSCERRPMTRSS